MADETTRTEAKPKRLRNGDWGCVVDGAVTVGEIVTIRTSSGKSWPVVIDKIIWSNGETSICATRERDDEDKAREQREGPVPSDAPAPARAAPRTRGSATPRAPDQDGEPAAPPAPPTDDSRFDALADAEAVAQAQRADEDDEVMTMAHSFSRDF